MVEKTGAFKKRRAEDTRRWRERLANGKACYTVEVDGTTFDLMERFGGVQDSKTADRQAVGTALGKVLRRAVGAMVRGDHASGPSEGRSLVKAGISRMSALGANRTRRDGGNDVNDPFRTQAGSKSRSTAVSGQPGCAILRLEAQEGPKAPLR